MSRPTLKPLTMLVSYVSPPSLGFSKVNSDKFPGFCPPTGVPDVLPLQSTSGL